MVRAAIASKRILLVSIPHPIPFVSLFAPSALDWRMGDLVVPDDAIWWRGERRVGLLQSNAALDEPNKFVAVEGHNQIHILPVRNAPDMDWVGLAAHCTFRALFRPSPQVLKVGFERLNSLLINHQVYDDIIIRFSCQTSHSQLRLKLKVSSEAIT